MAKKKSVKKCAEQFKQELERIRLFVVSVRFGASEDEFKSWIYEYAIIRAYAEFEKLILNALIGAVNNDIEGTLGNVVGVKLPKHLTEEVCQYLIVGERYFDFRGRSGLIETLKRYLPGDHYLVTACEDDQYRESLDRLVALRNFAAHSSSKAKVGALKAVKQKRIASSGSWLKRNGRLDQIISDVRQLGTDIEQEAPY